MRNGSSRLVRAGLTTGVVDGLWAVVLSVFFYGSTFTRLWQGVASVLIGKRAIDGGTQMTALGLLMHFGVAFFWSAVFVLLFTRSRWLQRVTSTTGGVIAIAAIYGPFIWAFMSLVVIPMLTHRPPNVTSRWFIQLAGHIPFVGLPIVATASRPRIA